MFRRLFDAWISRYAKPQPEALDAVAGLRPVVVVTGASRGIGLAIARRFARAGRDVALVARDQEELDRAATAIAAEFAVAAIPIAIDVMDERAPLTLDERLAANGCYLDVLVNNAGTGLAGRFDSHTEADVVRLLELNMTALTRLMHHALPRMIARGRGGVLNIASLGGLVPGPYQAAYYASKAYVVSLTEAVGFEIRGQGVRLSVLAPGPVETGFHADMGAEHSPYRYLILPVSPETAATSAYRGYVLGRRLIVPGLMNKVLAPFLRVLPHAILLPLIGWLLWPRPDREWAVRDDTND